MAVNLDHPYELDPSVALRPEPFGALAYHFGNRRLSFLKHPDMVRLVQALADAASVRDALTSVGVAPARWNSFLHALDTLEASEMIRVRSPQPA